MLPLVAVSRKRLSAIVRWALLALAWTQVVYALHQDDHALSDRDTACAVCAHLDRLGDAPPVEIMIALVPPCHDTLAAEATVLVALEIVPSYRSRAPPHHA